MKEKLPEKEEVPFGTMEEEPIVEEEANVHPQAKRVLEADGDGVAQEAASEPRRLQRVHKPPTSIQPNKTMESTIERL